MPEPLLSVQTEEIRSKIAKIRSLLYDNTHENHTKGWAERYECLQGLLTCGLVTLYSLNKEVREWEIKAADKERGPHLQFGSRGIGTEYGLRCFACGITSDVGKNIAAFVASKEDGEKIVEWFGGRARLDFRPSEPTWIQVKVGACSEHVEGLTLLDSMAHVHGVIRQTEIVEVMANPPKKEPVSASNELVVPFKARARQIFKAAPTLLAPGKVYDVIEVKQALEKAGLTFHSFALFKVLDEEGHTRFYDSAFFEVVGV